MTNPTPGRQDAVAEFADALRTVAERHPEVPFVDVTVSYLDGSNADVVVIRSAGAGAPSPPPSGPSA